jgi:homoserine kinase
MDKLHLSAGSFEASARARGASDARRPPAASFVARRVVVDVPATCANLGPGFDCLALALRLHNRFEVTLHTDEAQGTPVRPLLQIHGARADVQQLGKDDDNLFLRSFRALCQAVGVAAPPVSARLHVRVPPGRGLGSSATAVVGGILAANIVLGGPLGLDELLELAITCEPGHHPDNVAAALLGGLVVTGARAGDDRLASLTLPIPATLRAVLFVPDLPMSTAHSRAILPATYAREDATYNMSRVALLLAALQTERFELLGTAMEDRLHQPYRQQLFPALGALIAAGRAAGAHGVCLAGSGSAVLALVTDNGAGVRQALEATAQRLGVAGHGLVVELARAGAQARIVQEGDGAESAPEEGASDGE